LHKKLSETEPYPPSEDTFFLADYIKNEKGDWTVEEGEYDLFITNNKTGKKFKFKLEEVT